jgi:hypothetical protein
MGPGLAGHIMGTGYRDRSAYEKECQKKNEASYLVGRRASKHSSVYHSQSKYTIDSNVQNFKSRKRLEAARKGKNE